MSGDLFECWHQWSSLWTSIQQQTTFTAVQFNRTSIIFKHSCVLDCFAFWTSAVCSLSETLPACCLSCWTELIWTESWVTSLWSCWPAARSVPSCRQLQLGIGPRWAAVTPHLRLHDTPPAPGLSLPLPELPLLYSHCPARLWTTPGCITVAAKNTLELSFSFYGCSILPVFALYC